MAVRLKRGNAQAMSAQAKVELAFAISVTLLGHARDGPDRLANIARGRGRHCAARFRVRTFHTLFNPAWN